MEIGCTMLCGLDDNALKGVLAHELAHIKKRHTIKISLLSIILLIPMIVCVFLARSWSEITIFLTFALMVIVWIFLYSSISWHNEYEADAVASEYVGKQTISHALTQAAGLINRHGDTLTHPSFKKRISHLPSDKE